jgi:multicomponent Na+:H+ antiporter subunit F
MSGPAIIASAAQVILLAAILVATWRILRGPTVADRIVGIDLLAFLSVGFIAALSVSTDQPVLLDVAIVLALVTFAGTVALARYLESGRHVD